MKSLLKVSALFFSLALLVGACSNGGNETAFEPDGVVASANDKPLVIRLAVNDTYCKKTACICIHGVAAREYEEFQAQLKKEFNIDLQLSYFMEPYHMEDELRAKTFDGVICKPWTAFMLSEEHQINYKRVVDVLDAFDNQWLQGVFMVPKESPIKSMKEISGKTVVSGQPDAFEKYHSPLRIFKEKGIEPGKLYQKASCLECINELLDNNAEVAIVSDYVMSASCAVDVAQPEDFRIIGETEKMPLTSVILDMEKVNEADALRLQKALLALSGENTPETMLSKGFVKPASWEPVPYIN